MSKNKNKKKERMEKLRSVLDSTKNEDLNPDDEKHLKALSKRLKETSEKNSPNVKITYKIGKEKNNDPLTPRVTVHERKIKKDVKKIELAPPEKKEIEEVEKKQLPDDDIFEVEKVEIKEPKFLAVKPKEPAKKKKAKKGEEDLLEWKEVKPEKTEMPKEEKVEEWEPVDIKEQVIEDEVEKDKAEVEEIEKKEEVKPVEEIKQLKEEEIDNQIKIDIFEDISCIDDKIAINLYDNGFNSLESIDLASINDIKYLTGISKRKVKKIKEEVDKKLKSIPEEAVVEEITIEEKVKSVEELKEVKEEPVTFIEVQETETKEREKEERKLEKERQKELKKEEKLKKIEAKKLLKEQKLKDALAEKEKKKKEKQEKLEAKRLLKEQQLQEALAKKEKEKELEKQKTIEGKTKEEPEPETFTEVEEIEKKEVVKPVEEFKEVELEKEDISGEHIEKEIEEEIHEKKETEPVAFIEAEDDIKEKPKLFGKIKKVKIKKKKEEEFEIEEEIEKEDNLDNQIKIDIFEDISCIDDKIAINLYDNGFNSLESIDLAPIEDIKSLTGISKRKVKKIKEVVDKKLKSISQETITEEDHKIKENTIEETINEGDITPIEEKPTKVKPIEIEETAELEIKEEELPEEEILLNDIKIEAFKEIESIDDETAVILYDNGYTTVDDLLKSNIDDLKKIKGLKKKKIKNFMKEINEKNVEAFKTKDIDIDETANALITKEQLKDEDEIIEEEEMELTTSTVELESDSTEWIPLEPVESEEKAPVKGKKIDDKNKIDIFTDVENIDDVTAIILYDAGYKSLESLHRESVDKLSKIKGIKKKQAKKIKKEIEIMFSETFEEERKSGFDLDVDFVEEEAINEDEMMAIDEQILNHNQPKDERHLVFKDIDCIDKKTAKLLVNNGIDSVEDLKDKTIKQLVAIKGIKRKLAKEIKKELEGEVEIKTKKSKKKAQLDSQFYLSENNHEIANPDAMGVSKENEGFTYQDYTLYEKEIKTKSNKKRIVRFFSKEKPEKAKSITLPDGYEVINNSNGVPYLKKKK